MLGFSREQLMDGGLTQRGGARPLTLRVRLYLRERILNFSTAMLVSASPVLVTAPAVFVAVRSLAGRTAMLMGLPFGASARVDVSEVERFGLGQIAQFELYEDPVRSVLEGGRAAHTGVMLGAQFELYVIAVGSVAILVGLGTAIGAAD
jgi:hypothetical protein